MIWKSKRKQGIKYEVLMAAEEVALQRRVPAGFGGSHEAEWVSSAGRCQGQHQGLSPAHPWAGSC